MKVFNKAGGSSRNFCLSLFVCLSVIITSKTIAAYKNNQEASKVVPAKCKSSGPYCGMYCLYTTIKLAGKEIDFRQLLKPKYIGSREGSSLAELKKAAEDNGLYAQPMGKLTSKVFRQFPHPIILHVKPDTMSRGYNHYELFLGTENGKAKLFDPPNPVRLVSFQELAPRWDGNGLIVSAEPIDLGAIIAPARKRFIIYAAITLIIILIVQRAKRWLPEAITSSRGRLLGLSMTEGTAFAIAALLCGMIYHFANNEGLLANTNATASIQQAHLGNFIPKVSEKKVRSLLGTDTVFIDARFSRDFKAGHLEGAISVPVDSNDVEFKKTTANIQKDARIVLYCQSAGCKFAERVAIRLIDDDFSDISIFKGGWAEWTAKNGRKKEKQI